MAKFNYRMENVLKIKEKIEEQKKMALGKSMNQLDIERRKENAIFAKLEDKISEFKVSASNQLVISQIQNMNYAISYYDHALKEQKITVANAIKNVERNRMELQLAVKEKKIQEKLKEKAKEAFEIEEKAKEQKILDEVVSFRYSRDEM